MKENPPNLNDISDDSSDKNSERIERRKVPRFNLSPAQFRLTKNNKTFPISNISEKGMGIELIDSEDLIHFSVGRHIVGKINLQHKKAEVSAVVKFISQHYVGLEFQKTSSELSMMIHAFLDPEVLGRELKPIPTPEAEKGMLWYHGPSGTDLIITQNDEEHYTRATLYMLGYFVQWDDKNGLKTGQVRTPKHMESMDNSSDHALGAVFWETLTLEADKTPDSIKLQVAKKLIMSSNVMENLKNWCLEHLNTTLTISH